MVAAFPVAKLGALLIKQISKPLANIAKTRAKRSPFFRNYICMPPAQFYHWCEVKLKMWSMNLGKPVNIPKLTEASAIELGSELVGEGLIFIIAAGILIAEYARQIRKETVKEAERIAHMEQIQNDLKTLYTAKSRQEAQIAELIRILEAKIPDSNFNPTPFDEASIPAHHREDYNAESEEGPGAFATMKGWVSSAIDFVLPPVSNDKPEDAPKIVIVHRSSSNQSNENCECKPNVNKPGGSEQVSEKPETKR